MAVGDRVVIGTGYVWEERTGDKREVVMTYAPLLKEGGGHQVTPDGSAVIEAQGGVVAGSTGTIHGPAINVHRSYLHNMADMPAGFGGADLVQVIPVMLDKYQRVGWFPVDNIRIFGGSPQ